MSLEGVRTFRVPRRIVEQTGRALRRAGRDGYELFVLWSGAFDDEATFAVSTPHVPKQSSYKTASGLLVRVDGAALHQLNTWLYEHEQTLAAQVHAHPTEAFHSDTDDSYPIVTTRGGLSIVAADFAKHGMLTCDTAVYRLDGHRWSHVNTEAVEQLLEVVD